MLAFLPAGFDAINARNLLPALTARAVGYRVGVTLAFSKASGVGDDLLGVLTNRAMASTDVYRPPPIWTVSSGPFFLRAHRQTVAGLSRFPTHRLWWTAMNRGQFVALYAPRAAAEGTSGRARPWRESYVPTEGGGPAAAGDDEYGRYEPDYDAPFLSMCLTASDRFRAIAVPRVASAGDAMACLAAFGKITVDLGRRLFDHPGERRPKSDRRVGDLIRSLVPLRCEWAYVMGLFGRVPVTVLLATDAATLDAFASADPDRYYFEVLERW